MRDNREFPPKQHPISKWNRREKVKERKREKEERKKEREIDREKDLCKLGGNLKGGDIFAFLHCREGVTPLRKDEKKNNKSEKEGE